MNYMLFPQTLSPPPLRTQVVFRAINDYSRVTLIAQMEGMKFTGLAYSASTAELSFAAVVLASIEMEAIQWHRNLEK